VELTDSIIVASLIGRSMAEQKISGNSSRAHNSRLNRRPKCQCGSCFTCSDNAKWDRIFSEKFEDPNYYKPRLTWGVSSISSF